MGSSHSKHQNDSAHKESEDVLLPGTHVRDSTGVYLWEACTKNPGHPFFIPSEEFTMSDLPLDYQKDDVMNCIKLLSSLTCKVVARFVSNNRKYPDKLYRCGGKNVTRCGSGTVFILEKVKKSKVWCSCIECQGTVKKQKVCARIKIMTSCHVVFDDDEAKSTTFDLFYDDETNTENVRKLYGNCVLEQAKEKDCCLVECLTHDAELADLLDEKLKELKKFNSIFDSKSENKKKELSVVVSHPHGRHKMITLGKMEKIKSYYPIFEEDQATYFIPGAIPGIDSPQQSEVTGIEVSVKFMDGRVEKFNIWMLERPVKETKNFIVAQCGVGEPPETLNLVLELSAGEEQVMDDDKEINYYWNDLTQALFLALRHNNANALNN